MKIINVFLVSLSLFMIANKLVVQAADYGLQAADEISALQEQNTMLQNFLLEAQAKIAAQTEQAALAQRQRELMDEMLADLRRDAQNTNINLANTLALLTKQQELAAGLEQDNQELSRRAEELADALSYEELNRVSAAFLRERLESAEAALNQKELEQLSMAAAIEKLRADLEKSEAAEKQRLQELRATLDALDAAKITATSAVVFQSRLAESEARLEIVMNSSREELKALEKDKDDLRSALSKAIAARQTSERQLTAAEQKAALSATARAELREAEAISAEAQRRMALLSEEVRELRAQIGVLETNKVKITNLGRDLNVALAQVAAESKRNLALEAAEKQRLQAEKARLQAEAKTLERYKSDFFGSLRGLLRDIEGVSIVGDRFVFSSEVLFASGRAELTAAGRTEISKVANILKDVTEDIPQNIDWVLQVDGHTDNQPTLPGSKFQNNWELSQARALSVVLYLATSEQMQPSRLSANGFGEYQPINPANSRRARAQNRRIELKLTER